MQQSLFPELSGAFREAYPSANVLAVTERDFDSPLMRIPVDVGTRFHWMWAPDSV